MPPEILRAGGPQLKEAPPATEDRNIIEIKRDYMVISAFFQSIMMNINTLDKNTEYLKQYKDLEKNLIMTLVIMTIRALNLQRDEFAVLYNSISGIPISEELLKILFEEPIDENSTIV